MGDPEGDYSPPCRHHYLTDYHFRLAREHKTLGTFTANLLNALEDVFPKQDSYYKTVYVLLIDWKFNDLNTQEYIKELNGLFCVDFGF